MRTVLYLSIAFNILAFASSQYFSSGFYQGGFQAQGFSPFPHGGHPFGGVQPSYGYAPGIGGSDAQTHVHYHVSPNSGGFGGGGFGGGGFSGGGLTGALNSINTRDVGAGAVGFILGSLINRN